MKIYKTQAEVEQDIKNGILDIEGDVEFRCSISISAVIKVAGNINARDINAWDINAGDINAWYITARDINARDITARDINARDILYHAFCCVYRSIKCLSIKAKRNIYHEPICLEGKIEYKEQEKSLIGEEVEVKVAGKTYKAKIVG